MLSGNKHVAYEQIRMYECISFLVTRQKSFIILPFFFFFLIGSYMVYGYGLEMKYTNEKTVLIR